MSSEPARGSSAVAAGDRNVVVGGDVTGSVIVTGDNVDVRLLLGSEHGALIEKLSRLARPTKELRPAPLQNLPEQPADSIDRDTEARAIASSDVGPRNTLNVHGDEGVGKTYALLRALGEEQWRIAATAVYVHAAGGLDDVLQAVFDAFYERNPPSRSAAAELRRDLAQVSGLVVLDSVDMDREAAQQLQLALLRCSIVVVSRERVVWGGGTPIAVHGLEPEFAIALIESEIGRRLDSGEREPAQRICAALGGHPLRLREAVAPVRSEGRSLAQIADQIAGADAREALAATRLADADAERRRLLATLALFAEEPVGREHLKALVNAPNADELIDRALASRDLHAHSPRYSLGLTAADAARSLDLAAAGDRALAYFVRWAHATHDEPTVQLIEGAALLALLRWAVANGRLREAIELGRAIDSAFAVGRRFDAWRECLELVRSAAVETGDRAAEAWAVHQLGTRALALGDLEAGTVLLHRALALRRELDDRAGAAVTERNLAVARRLARARRGIWRNPFLLLLVGALLVAGVVSATAGSHHSTSAQNGGGPHDHNVVTVATPMTQHTVAGSSAALQIEAADSAGAKLTYAAGGLPPGLGVNETTGLIGGRPSKIGTYPVTVGADDKTGANNKAHFQWIVTQGVPRTVTVTNPGTQTNAVGKALSVPIHARDSANAPLSYAASMLPAGLNINSSSGQISGTPMEPTTNSVTVTAKDASGAGGGTAFQWTITAANGDTVTVTNPGSKSGSVHSRVNLPIVATGEQPLTYLATGLPHELSIDPMTGEITGDLDDKPAVYPVTVTVTDAANHIGKTHFTWTVTPFSTGTGTGTSTSTGATTGTGTATSASTVTGAGTTTAPAAK